ncbi:DNA topoisomerase I [Haloplanus sp.]|uniref:DNA topoisomerase I n=1 Tax=Haloplanus sp. TaxID=1961696 RepID=UPI00261F74BF|nr:DNA topoisomerase I [Haloplanus sp.]
MNRGPELIITEKDNAARRIAEILSDGSAESDRVNGVNVYKWGGKRCVGLSGHVVGVDFPPEYDGWRDVEPVELVDAEMEKRPTQENIVAALRRLARNASRIMIATDYDREGELIGKEAYELVREVNDDSPVDRVRFSSITDREVTEAFADPDELDFDLAAAGEARQIVDLMWGASLTRYLSLSAGQLGDDFISVGRVQGPTLKLIVDREREIDAFDPETYRELFATLQKDEESFEAQYFYLDGNANEAERVWDGDSAAAVDADLSGASTATVEAVRRRTRTDDPPAPFNTTQFIRAASGIGHSAQRAMSIAEDLYTEGYITYPRTDNTVYPEDLDPRDLLDALSAGRRFGDDAAALLDADDITPTEGDEETTDHPPIHPTDELPAASDLSEDEWEVYELVVRRFLATVADAATWQHLRVVAGVTGDRKRSLKANGKRLVDPGYHAVYPYRSTSENHVPDVTEGETLDVTGSRLETKQTQPPRRYGQSRLIETMEEMGIGTKATRHDVIQKLYDRGYIEGDPPRPTRLARGVVEASEEFADLIVSEEMTAQLEADMQAIARGEATLSEVTDESREMLGRVFDRLMDSREALGDHLRESLKADKTVGPCPACGDDLVIRRSGQGSYFVGCDAYPDCENTLPLPSTGKPLLLDDVCGEHGLHDVKMLAGRKTFVHGCPLCAAEAAEKEPDLLVGPCPECGDADGGDLAVKRLRSGGRLVGCTRYPDCEYSLPMPRHGEAELVDEACEQHGLPGIRITYDDDRDPWDLGCPICNYREYQARQEGTELETINGIGEKTAEKLNEAGIEDVAGLKTAEPDALADEIDGVGEDTVRDWQADAD